MAACGRHRRFAPERLRSRRDGQCHSLRRRRRGRALRRQDPAARAVIFRGSSCFAPVGEGQSSTVSGDQGFAVENSEGGVGERGIGVGDIDQTGASGRSEEHTSELQSLMRISYAVFCLKKKKKIKQNEDTHKKQKKNMTKIKRQKRIYVVYEAIEIRVKSNTDQTNIHNKGQ